MAYLKSKAGHRSCKGIYDYLMVADDGSNRALGVDLYNIQDQAEWWRVMDDSRECLMSESRKSGSGKSRQYWHFILTPSADDHATLEQVRDLANLWVKALFANDYEVAIVYHDDNGERVASGKEGIVHAHVVVNSVSFTTGKKLHINNEESDLLADTLQTISARLGLTAYENMLENSKSADRSYKRENRSFKEPASIEMNYDEHRIVERGGYSWKNEIRVVVERSAPFCTNLDDLRRHLAPYGFGVRRVEGGLLFINPEGKKVRDTMLGSSFNEKSIQHLCTEVSFYRINTRRYESFAKEMAVKSHHVAAVDPVVKSIRETLNLIEIIEREGVKGLDDLESKKLNVHTFGREGARELMTLEAEMEIEGYLYDHAKMVVRNAEVAERFESLKGSARSSERFYDEHRTEIDDYKQGAAYLANQGRSVAEAASILEEYRPKAERFLSLQAEVEGSSRRYEDLSRAQYVAERVLSECALRENEERIAMGLGPKQPPVNKVTKAPKDYSNAKKAPVWNLNIFRGDKYKEITTTNRAARVRLADLAGQRRLPPYIQKDEQVRRSIAAQRKHEAQQRQEQTSKRKGR